MAETKTARRQSTKSSSGRKTKTKKKKEKIGKVRVISLGGLDHIGMNMTLIEYEDSIIIIDCGMAFADDTLLGIDLIIPT